jgi:tetratricopeptide (TPR) repeat protein
MSTCTRFCTSTAQALLFGFLAQNRLGVARAQGVVLGDVENVKKSAAICADEAQPPAVRVASCTLVMRRAVLTNAAHAKILYDRASALTALGKLNEAIADFTEAIELDPNRPEVLYSRALAAERMGNLKVAEGDRRRAAELDNSSHE